MNALEKLCLDEADEMAVLAELFLKQFDDNPEIKLIGPITLSVARYKTNRNLLETMRKAMPQISEVA